MNHPGKGSKAGKVALPPLARMGLDQYLMQRGLSVVPARWNSKTPLVANLDRDGADGITSARLWHVMRRFFQQAADLLVRKREILPATISMTYAFEWSPIK